MSDPERIPKWLKSLPLAPEYHPTETEFADPISFISRIEREASAFGICKIVPPLPKPSKKFVLSNLTRSFAPNSSRTPSSSSPTRFTTRHQELGARREPAHRHRQQVWQSGEFYTLDQFESKSKSFQKSQLSGFKEVTPLLIEALFWKAASEKPIYIEYANDVPGSGFAAHEEPFLCRKKRRKLAEQVRSSVDEGTAGWKLSNSSWNLQVIARSPGSLTRFMPDEVPGVTSPMVYIGMLFSWFAWHVEDHELHSLNFLHMGAPKTWYAVGGEHASRLEEIVRVEGYGGDLDRLEAFTMLGEKTTLLSPEVIVKSGVPCCRLVQNPGDFVVTFPRAYHIGFSHGFNCGEAANFATPQWLKVAKEAAVRRAAMNHLPMLSHQQLLYMLTVSFVSRVPRALLSGVRISRLSDRKREEREILVKKAFLSDMMNENNLMCALIQKGSTSYAVLWEPDLLPNPCTVAQSFNSSLGVQGSAVIDDEGKDITPWKHKDSRSSNDNENPSYELTANPTSISCHNPVEKDKNASHADDISSVELLEILDAEEDDLPFGLNIDSGTLACVACGILGYPFMAIMQPSEAVSKELLPATGEDSHMRLGKSGCSQIPSCLPNTASQFGPEGTCIILQGQESPNSRCKVSPAQFDHVSFLEGIGTCDGPKLLNDNGLRESMNTKTNPAREIVLSKAIVPDTKPFSETHSIHGVPVKTSSNEKTKWTSSHGFNKPRIFCLQHAFEVDELLHSKGGAHMLVICHSDYLKIKAYIPSIAEEVGMGINITDVPLENASPSDLNLINISIDNGEHEDHGEDWTSKLGVNLRYSMKLRKQSTLKQERLTLALRRIFSDPVSLSDFSTLKWHSKRSRTPYKIGISVPKSHIDANMENSNVLERYFNAKFSPMVKDFQSCRRNPNDMPSKHRGFKNVQKEFGSSNGSSVVNVKDGYSTASYSHNLSERVEVDHTKGLFTVHVSSTEDLQMQGGSWFPLKVSRADEVTNSESSESHHLCVLIPVLESSDICQGTNSPVQFLTNCRVDNSKNQESQPHLLELEATNSEVPDEIEALDEINSEHKVYNNVESDIDPASQGAVAYTGNLQDFPMPQEHKSTVSGLVNYLLPAEQSHVPALSNDTAELELSNSDESNLELNISHSLKSVGQIVSYRSNTDRLGVHQKEIPMVKVSVEEVPKMEDSGNHSSNSVKQVFSNPSTIDQCRIQEKEILQLGVPIGEKPQMEGRIDPSLRSEKHFVEHPSSVDSCRVQQELSTTEEPGEDGNDHSSRSERLLVSNLPILDTTCGMQQEIPDTENNLWRVSNVQLVTQQNAPMVVSFVVQQEISVDGTNTDNKVISLKPVVDCSSANSEHITVTSAAESSEAQESDKNKEIFIESCNKNQKSVCIIQYVRRRSKRKREEQMAEDHHNHTGSFICSGREEKNIPEDHQSCNGSFIRGPCEGLRPRTRQVMGAPEKVGFQTVEQNRAVSSVKRRLSKGNLEESVECDIQGGCSKSRRKGDLHLHMQNKCIYRGCRKQFRSHKDLMRHLRVHDDERPLKCPWKGCWMSFKWEWARTEHLRIHTGERPYQCTVAGCELTFRYVSDFSRHRRKTGHYVNQTDR